MNLKKQQIHSIIEEIVHSSDYLLIDTVVRGSEHKPVIEVFIDSAEGVTTIECADISGKLHAALEDKDIVNQSYRLDVSSPGIDRPLKFIEQFPRNIDRKFKIIYNNDETTSEFEGKLKSINNTELCFSVKEEEEVVVEFTQVVSAHVLISF
jgi:ribosome maturation factor RimP